MKTIAFVAALMLVGCGLTPTQKKVAGIVGSVLIVGAIAAHEMDNGVGSELRVPTPVVDCQVNPESCR